MSESLRTVIVDDERLARSRLRALSDGLPDIEVIAECANGHDALEVLRTEEVDLLFLDVQMPGMSGFDLLRQVGPDAKFAVIFVTAYDEYAFAAFEAAAVDYLLKPFTRDRFCSAVERARKMMGAGHNTAKRIEALLKTAVGQDTRARVVVKTKDGVRLIDAASIDWIHAANNYVRVYAGDERHLVRSTMNEMCDRLDKTKFLRVHNSAIVNLDKIVEAKVLDHGDLTLVLTGGEEIRCSRSYAPRVRPLVGLD